MVGSSLIFFCFLPLAWSFPSWSTGSELIRLLRDFNASDDTSRSFARKLDATGSTLLNQNDDQWCITKQSATVDVKGQDRANDDGVSGRIQRSFFSVCRIEKDVRICRTVKSLNATATEDTVVVYKCCNGLGFDGAKCVPKPTGKNKSGSEVVSSGDDAVQESLTSAGNQSKANLAATEDLLKNHAFFDNILQKLVKGSLRSQALFAKAMDIQPAPSTLDEEDEEDDSEPDRTSFPETAQNHVVQAQASSASVSRNEPNSTFNQISSVEKHEKATQMNISPVKAVVRHQNRYCRGRQATSHFAETSRLPTRPKTGALLIAFEAYV